jgi:uncharacterized protein (DUF342 family)
MGQAPNDYYNVHVSADGLRAVLTLASAPPAGSLGLGGLKQALSAAGVTHGIDEIALQQLVDSPAAGRSIVAAQGTAARDGADEQIVYHFDAAGAPEAANPDDPDATVDFRNVRNFNSTRAGAVIAEKRRASAPQDGVSVTGQPLKAKAGRALSFKLGKGAQLSPDGERVLAEVDGHACVIAERIGVLATVEVPAHVDFSIGNIAFIGSVRVRGNVVTGFSVEAGGDIEVQGNVEKCLVKAGRNLTVRGIVFGQGDCLLTAGGDAQLNAADQATLQIQGDLTLSGYLRHCTCLVGGKVELTGKRGNIVGGEVHAFRGVSAPFIGNQMATLTRIKVGSNPFISGAIDALLLQQLEQQKKLEQVQLALAAQLKRKGAAPDPALDAVLGKLRAAEVTLSGQLGELEMQLAALQGKLAETKDAKIRVSEIAYPGVLVNFRDRLQYKTMDELQRLCFYEDASEIRTGAY